MNNETLQLVNILLTSGVLLAMLVAAVAYGRLTQKVDTHDSEIDKLRKGQHDVRELFVEHIARNMERK